MLARRHFLSLFPAPLIVAAANIMPVKVLKLAPEPELVLGLLDDGSVVRQHEFIWKTYVDRLKIDAAWRSRVIIGLKNGYPLSLAEQVIGFPLQSQNG